MDEQISESEFDGNSTCVEVVVFLPGNAGCNNARIFIDDTDPAEAPGLHLVAIDSDGPLLKERFSLRPEGQADEGNLRKWMESGRFHTIQLSRNAQEEIDIQKGRGIFRRHRKLFGAGGDVEAGRRAVKGALPRIEEIMEDKDLVICWGAGGGGTGTAAIDEIIKIAEKKGIPSLCILITPFANEGSKIAIADQLRKKLREGGRTLVIKNENLPQEKRELLLSEAWKYINSECRPLFRTLREYTQVVGTSANADLEDLLTAFEKGNDVYIGIHEISLTGRGKETPRINGDDVVFNLLGHTFQEKGISAEALLFCFRGPWSVAGMDSVISGVQRSAQCSPSTCIKKQSFETYEEMWVSVIVVGSYQKVASSFESREVIGITGQEKLKPYWTVVEGRRVELWAPETLIDLWKEEVEKEIPSEIVLEGLSKEFRRMEQKNRAPDIPARARKIMPKSALCARALGGGG